ncbi:MAG TPA: hypothetical protein VFL66_12335 [Gaiellaceae bacterium]|nr:hypothetical protein [Gaiellaceae bacterium]
MALRNRVTPLGEIVADPARGLVYGNRGCLHDARGELRRQWQVKRWIACRLEFPGRRRHPLRQPGRYTELFFLDEATAFAAGHRPCAECRRADYDRVVELCGLRAEPLDRRLHAERLDGRARRLHETRLEALPDGAFVLDGGEPWLVRGRELLRWTAAGYRERRRRPRGRTLAVTPPTLLELLAAGWEGGVPLLHPTAARK